MFVLDLRDQGEGFYVAKSQTRTPIEGHTCDEDTPTSRPTRGEDLYAVWPLDFRWILGVALGVYLRLRPSVNSIKPSLVVRTETLHKISSYNHVVTDSS